MHMSTVSRGGVLRYKGRRYSFSFKNMVFLKQLCDPANVQGPVRHLAQSDCISCAGLGLALETQGGFVSRDSVHHQKFLSITTTTTVLLCPSLPIQ